MKFTVECDDPRLKAFYDDLFDEEFMRAYEKTLEENAVHYFVTGELPPALSSWDETLSAWQD